jgi:hypothetical protein
MGKRDVHRLSSDTETPRILLGISSHENDYRLSWAINQHLGYKFTKAENYQSFNQRLNENQEFSTYCFVDEENGDTFRLISNRCDNGFLLDELKNIDFLLLIDAHNNAFNPADLLTKVKAVPFVSAIFKIEINTLKNKKRIV